VTLGARAAPTLLAELQYADNIIKAMHHNSNSRDIGQG